MFRLFGEKTEQTSKRVRCIDDFIESAAVCIFNRHFVEVTFYNVVKFLYSYIVNKISSTLLCFPLVFCLFVCFTEIKILEST